jgi:hypothetical protein
MSSPRPLRRRLEPNPPPQRGIPVTGGLWPVISGLLLVALLGIVVWNISLRNDVEKLEDDLAMTALDNASLRERANATVYQLVSTGEGPDNANGQAWFSVQGSGVLSVANMPPLPDGSTYQLWYGTDTPTSTIPGGTFGVDDTGQGFMLIPSDVGVISSISITREPEGGSQTPGGPVFLESDVDGARG